ncbi:hypothetical protein F0562_022039 [Nyssa sinensis]|uniref:Uncharacterized protein n=1 Tax=Nyssa sinensis TaxID=561372 RepID=A0A5J5BM85_9ASTE|nr:hypothetical protein F0562_022039 [Nyssa sinensis]
MDRIVAANELAFRVGFSGHSGHLRVEPLPPVEGSNPVKSLPDFILDPLLDYAPYRARASFVILGHEHCHRFIVNTLHCILQVHHRHCWPKASLVKPTSPTAPPLQTMPLNHTYNITVAPLVRHHCSKRASPLDPIVLLL